MKIYLLLLSGFAVSCQAVGPLDALGSLVPRTPKSPDTTPTQAPADPRVEIRRGAAGRTGAQDVEVRLVEMSRHSKGQTEPVWCWAACARMIYAYHGIEVTQEQLAETIHGLELDGSPKVAAATRYQLMLALNRDVPRNDFERIWNGLGPQLASAALGGGSVEVELNAEALASALLEGLSPNKTIPTDELEQGEPAVLALRDPVDPTMGHIYLLCGAEYTDGTMGVRVVDDVNKVAAAYLPNGLGTKVVNTLAGEAIPNHQSIHRLWLYDPAENTFAHHPFDEVRQRLDFVLTASQARQTLLQWQNFTQVAIR